MPDRYVSTKKDGSERLNFTALYEALLEAKGVSLGGKAYTAQLDLKPGDEFEIRLESEHSSLVDRSWQWDTMAALDGAGLAVPQIAVPLRVVIFCITHNPRYPEAPPIPETVLINPEITPIGAEGDSVWEGCLSVPGLRGEVSRWRRIHYRGCDVEGNLIDWTTRGPLASPKSSRPVACCRAPNQRCPRSRRARLKGCVGSWSSTRRWRIWGPCSARRPRGNIRARMARARILAE